MNYILKGHTFENDIQTITQVFYPNEKFIRVKDENISGLTVVSVLDDGRCTGLVYKDGLLLGSGQAYAESKDVRDIKLSLKKAMYHALTGVTGFKPPWGVLTGIRPVKLVHELFKEGMDETTAVSYLADRYYAGYDKIKLCVDVAKAQQHILSQRDGISIYIGIPFCPSICRYCSFTSYAALKYESIIDDYIDCLIKEIEAVKDYAKRKRLVSLYVGGGTPTALNDIRLERLLLAVSNSFNITDLTEFTVEAGRPDTITASNMALLKKYGVSRISINPQTQNDDTLAKIGRAHKAGDFTKAFYTARENGHDNINTDIILGLPGEDASHVEHTLKGIMAFGPENVTVHTLAVKRASRLKEELLNKEPLTGGLSLSIKAGEMEQMLALSQKYVYSGGMHPYYLYRQKNMIGGFENVGYSKPGKECLYNIHIMEETQTILAFGAGAITKTVDAVTNRIERIPNVKDVREYIARIDDMLLRKRELEDIL